jgi:uncharacterized integral membrane protein
MRFGRKEPHAGVVSADQAEGRDQPQADEPARAAAPVGQALHRTRLSAAWTTVAVGLVFLIALLVFIFQNLNNVRVTFLVFHGTFPLALSLLCSAVGGALIVLLLGVARMIQLRRAARRQRNAAVAASRSHS